MFDLSAPGLARAPAAKGCGSGVGVHLCLGGQNTRRWEFRTTHTRVIITIIIIISATLGARVPRQRGREGGAAAPRWRRHRPGPAPPGRPSPRPGSSRGRSDGVGVSDRSLHPQQRPGGAGRRVQSHAGLRGRLPAPGCNGRVTPGTGGSGRAGGAGGGRSGPPLPAGTG